MCQWGYLVILLAWLLLFGSTCRIMANQYETLLTDHFQPMIKHFYPVGNSLFQDDSAPNTLWTQFMPFFSFHFSPVCTLLRTLESSPVFPVLSTSIHVQHFYTFYTWISENRALTSAAPGAWCTPLPYCTRHKWTSKTCEKKRRGGKKKEAAEMDREYFINGLWKEMNGVLYTRQQF